MHFLGAHTVDAGGIHMAARRAAKGGMTALQIFTAVPKYYNDRMSIRPERVQRFKATLSQTKIQPEHVVVHGAYVLNVATEDEEKWTRASAGLTKELERSTALGVGAVCFHPGAASTPDRKAAAKRIAKAVTGALRAVKGETRLLVENTAGAGRTMARTADEVGEILRHIPDTLRTRTGYGLDTCHLFASGYDLTQGKDAFSAILDEFEEATGETPSFFHLNDSQGPLGSNTDRHVLIGEGQIGAEPFGWLLQDRRSRNVPLILETPQKNYEPPEDDDTPDEYDVRMMKLLARLRE